MEVIKVPTVLNPLHFQGIMNSVRNLWYNHMLIHNLILKSICKRKQNLFLHRKQPNQEYYTNQPEDEELHARVLSQYEHSPGAFQDISSINIDQVFGELEQLRQENSYLKGYNTQVQERKNLW